MCACEVQRGQPCEFWAEADQICAQIGAGLISQLPALVSNITIIIIMNHCMVIIVVMDLMCCTQ